MIGEKDIHVFIFIKVNIDIEEFYLKNFDKNLKLKEKLSGNLDKLKIESYPIFLNGDFDFLLHFKVNNFEEGFILTNYLRKLAGVIELRSEMGLELSKTLG